MQEDDKTKKRSTRTNPKTTKRSSGNSNPVLSLKDGESCIIKKDGREIKVTRVGNSYTQTY